MARTTLTERLAAAAAIVERLTPADAAKAMADGAIVVDIRSSTTRERDGVIPGSLHIPLTVLHWRLEPGGAWRTPHVQEGSRVVLVCDHGCSSLLAAAELVAMGVEASDVADGVDGWAEAGLPLVQWLDPPVPRGALLGMEPPATAVVPSSRWTGRTAGT